MSELAFLPGLAAGGAAALAEMALRGLVVLLAALAAAWGLRRAPASARHLVWVAAFAALLALPLLGALLPSWRVPLLPRAWAITPAADVAAPGRAEVVTVLPRGAVGRRPVLVAPRARPAVAHASADVRPLSPAAVFARLGGGHALALGAWLAGVELVLLSLIVSALRLRRVERRARGITGGPAAALLPRLMARAGVRRPVRLLEGDDATMPLTWGVLRPRILLPATHREWPADRLEAVLLHELAHVRRHDCATQLLAGAACALHWFNPLAWTALGRLRLEAEHACDDRVLAAGAPPADYAGHLLEVARAMCTRPTGLASVAMARRSQLRTRLLAVLSSERRRGGVPPAAVAGALAGAALVAIPLATLTPFGRARAPAPVSRVVTTHTVLVDTVAVATPSPFHFVEVEPAAGVHTAVTVDVDTVVVSTQVAAAATLGGDAMRLARARALRTELIAATHSALSAAPCRAGGRPATSRRDETDGRVWTVEWRRGECVGRARIAGVTFDHADGDVDAVARGGAFRLELRSAAGTGRVEIRPRRDGSLERRWWRDGRERPWGPEARAWMADALPELLRHTQYDEEQRS